MVLISFIQICLLVVILMVTSAMHTEAQHVVRYNDYLSRQTVETSNFDKLVHDLQPTVYVVDGELVAKGIGAPLVVSTSPENFNLLYAQNEAYSTVELLTIRLDKAEDTNNSLRLIDLKGFSNLKYLNVLFTYDACNDNSDSCCGAIVKKMFPDYEGSNLKVIYRLSIPQ